MIFKAIDPGELNINEHELSARLSMPCDLKKGEEGRLLGEVVTAAKPAYVATRVKITKQNGTITIGSFTSRSQALLKVFNGCSSVIVIVATLGVGIDRFILKKAQISAKEAFVIDALSDAMIEALCDLAEEEMGEGLVTRKRVSPGYADIELSLGKELIVLTAADKMLGIKLTESGMMIPQKSVNALIAVKDE